ncbi:TPA: ImmA/IrrE family metallo-endopeptidase [Legionella pneumophila]|uniref:ImmA/IrrE family metallo-endopeptidase n=1 Tax=Legionella pneumophila TaxID=446 RepID=UPI000776F12F|nr:ImmA/IrrE family metallo-endopeptidase [Legionella pneumophila]HAU0830367.1 ImmA/IrrE family metallo-endopeptidase [Legionella pneumophila]HBD7058691.1 ImmA/IrrE family metallo-endopeptidase [Legionella pneumophila]HCQ3573324.1 ImmA/IrrE family metallo-endopeptidase [Legionella pneumophila]HEM7040269.1 ImmA/IrrE family metallo-endopeptidase [Legionella pneumophila]HEO1425849.1 ImmA/IrrE family metallo-endopeptidase [Legionella pneumophila]
MRSNGFKVPPRSIETICSTANQIRSLLHPNTSRFVDIVRVLDIILPSLIPEFEFEICTFDELGSDHGRTYPDQLRIQIREDIYEGAICEHGRDRFTLAHELGHLVLHQDVPFAHNTTSSLNMKIYENSEWQADIFASTFLMPDEIIKNCANVDEIAQKCKVSISAARVRTLRK